MSTRTEDHRGVRADPAGFAWVVILGSALVIVIGLIGYLVVRELPGQAAPAPTLEQSSSPLAAPRGPVGDR